MKLQIVNYDDKVRIVMEYLLELTQEELTRPVLFRYAENIVLALNE